MKEILTPEERKGLRDCICNATQGTAAEHSDLAPNRMYLPLSHRKALSPDRVLVVAMRGAGKTYWWKQLQQPELRRRILGDEATGLICRPGFGQSGDLKLHPNRTLVTRMLREGLTGEEIWRAVLANILRLELPDSGFPELLATEGWLSWAKWVRDNVERVEAARAGLDHQLQARGGKLLVLFDALDNAADDWPDTRLLLQGLFRVLLDLRATRCIRGKAFVRMDLLTQETTSFVDASKLLAEKGELLWSRADLYSLFWQTLANEPVHGADFRQVASRALALDWRANEVTGIWELPSILRINEDAQRRLFHFLAGEWMGPNPRRGFPYPWLPNHLGDARQQVSPRSFLFALHQASEISRERHSDWGHVLHYDAIKEGVRAASIVRVGELREEYPWIETTMVALEGLLLPCDYREVQARWDQQGLLTVLKKEERPPARLEEGYDGLRRELVDLGLFSILADGRINMPDVYRIAYKIGRKGGIPPVR